MSRSTPSTSRHERVFALITIRCRYFKRFDGAIMVWRGNFSDFRNWFKVREKRRARAMMLQWSGPVKDAPEYIIGLTLDRVFVVQFVGVGLRPYRNPQWFDWSAVTLGIAEGDMRALYISDIQYVTPAVSAATIESYLRFHGFVD